MGGVKFLLMNHTIACLIKKSPTEYYIGDSGGWDNNVHRACLYAPHQAEQKLQELLSKNPDAVIVCVIQDKAFNYYDGKTFVYNLFQAKFYSVKEAEAVIKRLYCILPAGL